MQSHPLPGSPGTLTGKVFVMPEISTTGFEKLIAAEAPNLSRGRVKALAKRIAYRAQSMQEQFDFFAELRILGLVSDPTARDAIRNIEG